MIKKTVSELIDTLSILNIKIFFLIEKLQDGRGTVEEAQKVQLLNKQRTEYMNAINEEFNQKPIIKV